jgi:predicted transposase YbfD/YdcC
VNDLVGVVLGEFEELLITSDGVFKGGDLFLRNVTHDIASLFPRLVVVIIPFGPSPHATELATFHVLDVGDLFQQDFRFALGFHGDVYSLLYTMMASPNHPSSLIAHFQALPDPRVNRTKDHELIDVLVIAICTLLCAGETFNDMEDFGHAKQDWFKTFLTLGNGIPSHDTFNRVFAALDPKHFLECFLKWTQSVRQAVPQEIVALDGKALRRALAKDQSVQYVVSAWAEGNGLVLGQLKVADKSNEITAVPELLRVLELAGCIVTLDAMGCQKKIAREIVEADADYVLALKGNQEKVHEEVKSFLDATLEDQQRPRPKGALIPKAAQTLQTLETVEKDHGRIETRRYYQSEELDWFADRAKWEGLRSVGLVESLREIDGKVTQERRYYLSSLKLDVATFARAVRGHWGVENKLHWVMDVCFGEDQSRARAGYAAENLATLRRLTLNLLKREKTKKRGIRGKMRNASWDHTYLLTLLGGEPKEI